MRGWAGRVVVAWACGLLAAGSGWGGERAWIRLGADAELVAGDGLSPGTVRWTHASWLPEATRRNNLTFTVPVPDDGSWVGFSVTFHAVRDTRCSVNPMGPYRKVDGRLERIEIGFAELSVKGAALANGDFAQRTRTAPVGWHPNAQTPGDAPSLDKDGIRVWHNGYFSQRVELKAGEIVTLTGKCRKPPPRAESADERHRDAAFVPWPLAAVANMGFADPVAGDGVGGWSDQGPENDMAGFPVGRREFAGVAFEVVDPARNGGKSVVTLNLPETAARVGRVAVSGREAVEARYLYLLHASCFNPRPGKLGTVTAVLDDGRRLPFEVITGRDIADWWNSGPLENGHVAYRKQNGSSAVGVYVSRFHLGDTPVRVRSVEIASDTAPVWIVAGVTLSRRNAPPPPEERLRPRAGGAWKTMDTAAAVAIRPGSALDFSGLVEAGPAGKHGRATVGADGNLVFANRPERPVRFFSFNVFLNHLMDWKESKLFDGTPEETRANIRNFADTVRRHGYSMVRFQGLDLWLMAGKDAAYAKFDPERWDHFCYLLHCLKERGIYFGLDVFSKTGYEKFPKSQWYDGVAKRYKERMYFDPAARRMWRDGAKALLASPNPHTGSPLSEESALVFLDLHNEQELGVWISGGTPFSDPEIRPMAERAFRDFLRLRYHDDIGALAGEWKLPAPPASFDAVPLFTKSDLHADTAKGRDANEFMYSVEAEMLDFYRGALDELGYTGLATLYDALGQFRFVALRREVPLVTGHGYHNHPSNADGHPRMGQNGMLENTLQYFRYLAGRRVWNRPYMITEYNAPFWGRYRHQEGLTLPAYAALQDYAGITAHSTVVTRLPAAMDTFQLGRDPIGRAGQVVAAFAYGRGDVRPARRRVGVALSERYLRDPRNMNRGLAADQNRLVLLTGLGLVLDGKPSGILPGYPALDLVLPPAEGGEIIAHELFSVPVDRSRPRDFADLVARLRSDGILPRGNKTDPAKGVLQSETGELTLWTKEKRFTLDAPRLQGVTSEGGGEVSLRTTKFSFTLPGMAALAALDGEPISRSKRMLLVFSTDALNTGMELSGDRTTLYKPGELPALVETGALSVTVDNDQTFRCFALDLDGTRRDEIPVRREGGRCRIDLDTGTLPSGPALYFEWVSP